MKKIYIYFLLFFTFAANAQSPQGISYQAVARDSTGKLLNNQPIKIKFSIRDSISNGNIVYQEMHFDTTDAMGLFDLVIGQGVILNGTFDLIDWGKNSKYLQVDLDANTGIYTTMGTQKMMSVPYALYAGSAGSVVAGGIGNLNLVLPTITTNAVKDITSNSATFGGNISNANGNQIVERGIVYSTSPNPNLLSSNKIIVGDGIGVFDTMPCFAYNYILPNYPHLLKQNTTYYIRAYAINETNIYAYGNEVSFTTLGVGQTGPGGGIVFFDKGNANGGWRYLESAATDQSTGLAWGCFNTNTITGTQSAVGSGKANTSLIVAGCNDSSYAAKLCENLVLGGQSDWYLPSRDELFLMYKNIHLNSQGNFKSSNVGYWSSTEYDIKNAWQVMFYTGFTFNQSKGTYCVRAVRAF
jgi:hypothetical protein